MWWKLVLLTLYLITLFLLSRLLEAFAYYEGGYLASRLLDPVSVSVRKLKTLLDQRGVSYAGVVEKQELTELVEGSGEVSEGELEAATLTEDASTPTNFTCGGHFYEEVEDTKDSVWVVMVIPDRHGPFMSPGDWDMLSRKVSRFGVRTGIFDCAVDRGLCGRKQWYTSRLVIALPQGYKAKDNVVLRSYTGSKRPQAVLDWVNFNLASRIKEIYSSSELQSDWFTFQQEKIKEQTKLRVILISKSKIPPMFYSVLSVKFTGRVKFGIINTKSLEGQTILNETGWCDKVPSYMVLMPERNYTFGSAVGEYLNYDSMALFLKTLHPEVNDIFLLSLIVVNVMCWFEVVLARGNLFKRMGSLLWHIGKWNCLLILLWLPVLGLFQLPYMDMLLGGVFTLLRLLGTTPLASWVRADWLWYCSVSCIFPVMTLLAYATLVGIMDRLYQGNNPEPDANPHDQNTWWRNLHWDSYANFLFRPMSSFTRESLPLDSEMDAGMELFIERLAVPNFWLRPMISSQYLNDLPFWKYTGPCIESDVGSDTDCPSPSVLSDCEDGASSGSELSSGMRSRSMSQEFIPQQRPLMFICEKCRALQNNNEQESKTEQELEQERMESESACAKYVMDGNYKCMCQSGTGHGHGHSSGRGSRHSPRKERHHGNKKTTTTTTRDRDKSPEGDVDTCDHQMPSGMLPSTECAICLESYKAWALLCGLPCGHAFHHHCIMGWLSRDNHQCPVCRWPAYKAKPCSIHQHTE